MNPYTIGIIMICGGMIFFSVLTLAACMLSSHITQKLED
jgi:hypothetical protein